MPAAAGLVARCKPASAGSGGRCLPALRVRWVRRCVCQLEHEVVRVAEVPLLVRLVGADYRVLCSPVVAGGVFAGRLVAAADVAALLAPAKVHPVVPAGGDAFDATGARRPYVLDLAEVLARTSHRTRL